MRSQYLIIDELFLGILIAFAAYCTAARLMWNKPAALKLLWPGILVAIIIYIGPLTAYSMWNQGHFVYDGYFYGQLFNTPKAGPLDGGTGFLDIGGGRAVCEIDLDNCAVQHAKDAISTSPNEFRAAALHAILKHPIAFIIYKLPYIVDFFFAKPGYLASGIYAYAYVENTVFLLSAILTVILCIRLRRLGISWITLAMLIAAWIGCVAPSMFLHVEARYLFIAKAESLFACLTMGAVWLGERKRQAAAGLVPITDHDI